MTRRMTSHANFASYIYEMTVVCMILVLKLFAGPMESLFYDKMDDFATYVYVCGLYDLLLNYIGLSKVLLTLSGLYAY